ncbi:MAG TPA: hypothetical protein PKA27_10300 [Fimbriimonadaceae bacterium]|nr:hypothetical protein [Fimbriimonadaceae bacterium]
MIVSLLFTLAVAQDLTKTISYESPAVTLGTALDGISEKAGVRLTSPGLLERQLILVRFKDAPVSEVMKRVAEVAGGEWQPTNPGFRLVRTPAVQKALDEKEYSARLAMIKIGMERLRGQVQKEQFDDTKADQLAIQLNEVERRMNPSGEWDSGQWQAREKLTEKTPTALLAKRIALTFRPEDLATIKSDERMVFAVNPTRMQRPLKIAPEVLSTYQREQTLFVEALKKQPKVENAEMVWGSTGMRRAYEAPARVLVVVSSYSGGYYNLEVRLANQKGKVYVVTTSSVAPIDWRDEQKEEAPVAGETPMEPDGDAKGFLDAIKPLLTNVSAEPDFTKVKWPEGFKEKLLNPEQIDPFNLVGEWALRKYAEARKTNLVALVTDPLVQILTYAPMTGGLTPTRLEKSTTSARMDLTKEQGWTLITPKFRSEASQQTIDRALLGSVARRLASGAKLSLDEWADIAYRVGRDPWETLFSLYQMVLVGSMNMSMNWSGLRLYGSFDQNQRQGMKRGAKILYGNLGEPQRRMFHELAFGLNSHMGFSQEAIAEEEEPGSDEEPREYLQSLKDEITEWLPNGIPNNAICSMDFAEESSLFAIYSAQDRGWRQEPQPITPDSVAWDMFSKERQDLFPWANQQPSISEFANGKRTTITIKLAFIEKKEMNHTITDTDIPKEAKRQKLSELPAEFRAKVDEQLKVLRESYKDAKPGDFGGVGRGRVIPPRL